MAQAMVAVAAASDEELLGRFVGRREEAAFAALVERHSSTVWNVCRRVLRREADAEDAFQAVFILLARQAATIRKREAVGSWLYGVAYRVAMRARRSIARRHDRERQAEAPPAPSAPDSEAAFRDLQGILDEEIENLAGKYREPFVLCCLQGLTKAEAARILGCKEGTVSSQVTRARQLLRKRLARRGITMASALTAVALTPSFAAAAAPPALVHTTIQGVLAGPAAALLSPVALALADGLARLLAAKLKIGLAIVLVSLALVTGTGWAAQQLAPPAEPPAVAKGEAPGDDFYHDFRGSRPLPPTFAQVGRDAHTVIEPEEGGLRITTPANRQRTDKAGIKLTLPQPLTGDFEITTSFEILHADRPRGERGVGFSLYLTTEGALPEGLGLERLARIREGDVLYAFHMTTRADGKQHYQPRLVPSTLQSGQLRLSRSKDRVTFWAAEGAAGEFQQLPLDLTFAAPVAAIQLAANPGFTNHVVDLRLKELRIRQSAGGARPIRVSANPNTPAEAEAAEPTATTGRSRRWLWLAFLLFLLLTSASLLCLWLLPRRRAQAQAVTCSGCGARLAIAPKPRGKNLKCPKCGQAVLLE